MQMDEGIHIVQRLRHIVGDRWLTRNNNLSLILMEESPPYSIQPHEPAHSLASSQLQTSEAHHDGPLLLALILVPQSRPTSVRSNLRPMSSRRRQLPTPHLAPPDHRQLRRRQRRLLLRPHPGSAIIPGQRRGLAAAWRHAVYHHPSGSQHQRCIPRLEELRHPSAASVPERGQAAGMLFIAKLADPERQSGRTAYGHVSEALLDSSLCNRVLQCWKARQRD
jgi:hypothetical protein